MHQPAPLAPGTLVQGYQIVRNLAIGGFSIVYLATNARGQQVAIKEYLPATLSSRVKGTTQTQTSPDKLRLYRLGLQSFFHEGRALAEISHPGVSSVLDFFAANGTVYMVMNVLQGSSLQDFIVSARQANAPGNLQEATICSLFQEFLGAVRVVHQRKLLHLDLKPGNIFVTLDDRVVLIDFGAARHALDPEAMALRPMYTPGFAAPELYVRGTPLGPWTDVYSLGACLYSCMRGYPPMDVPTRRKTDNLVAHLERLRGVYSDGLLNLVGRCLSLEPGPRPQSVLELQKALPANFARSQ